MNITDLDKLAQRRLPTPIYDFLEGGADDQYSLRHNSEAFDQLQIKARSLIDVSSVDLSVHVLGQQLQWPLLLSPVGMKRMFHPDGELAAARAATHSGSLYTATVFSTISLEKIAAETGGPKMFQSYLLADPELNDEMVDRAKAAGYPAMCLTVDSIVGGNRETVIRRGVSIPPKLTLKSALQFGAKPVWASNYLKHEKWQLENMVNAKSLAGAPYALLDTKPSWEKAGRMIARWQGPFAIKGIMSAEDAKRAVEIGATAVIISNHGGRQLDATPAPIELLREVRGAVGADVEVIVDGGIRRGTHVLKALAMGATACSIGRPYLYGLAAGGQYGIERSLALLRSELQRAMILAGCSNIKTLDISLLRRAGFD
ncbi:alpha-hydroxy acid oxidase [Pseudomaricurvus hydrocarbonicus]|uniref:alpha-hydroxy acid oxidase n=1 Tax=Pseudomaricurvus hydrocarbonicus TaxID=1470433 RepID=UPI001AA044F5|nr:alpha-hydroxy acid oxidase [Aestuariicella hydrocarbonica]